MAASLAACLFVALIFLVWPNLDLQVGGLFALGHGRFAGQTPLGEVARKLFYWAPFSLFVLLTVLYGLKRAGRWRLWAPTGAGVLFMALSLAIGPGLLVNGILKNHSHRPRPYQVELFGGDEHFQPFYSFSGQCRRNCSFVSGEGSAAVWTLAPALLAPTPWRPVAIGAALVFSLVTSLLRMAFGGHFFSDSLFAALFTWLTIILCWRIVKRFATGPMRDPA